MVRISVVAPARNEEKNIPLFMDKVDKVFKDKGLDGEVLIIDDASTDNTNKVAKDLSSKFPYIRIIEHKKRKGLTGAIKTGFDNAKGDIIVMLPTDLESDPEEDIPKLLEPVLRGGYDISIGWRQGKKEGFIKKLSSKFFNLLCKLLFGLYVHDLGWVKAIKREVIENTMPLRSDWHRFFVILAASEGYKIKEIKTKFHSRKYGISKFGKLGLARIPGGIFDLLVVKFHVSFSKKPMLVFGMVGTIMMMSGFIGGLYLLYIKLTTGVIGNRLPLIFLIGLLILSGIQLFALGFLAEFLVTMNEEFRKR